MAGCDTAPEVPGVGDYDAAVGRVLLWVAGGAVGFAGYAVVELALAAGFDRRPFGAAAGALAGRPRLEDAQVAGLVGELGELLGIGGHGGERLYPCWNGGPMKVVMT